MSFKNIHQYPEKGKGGTRYAALLAYNYKETWFVKHKVKVKDGFGLWVFPAEHVSV